jgi:hypothetical protein
MDAFGFSEAIVLVLNARSFDRANFLPCPLRRDRCRIRVL